MLEQIVLLTFRTKRAIMNHIKERMFFIESGATHCATGFKNEILQALWRKNPGGCDDLHALWQTGRADQSKHRYSTANRHQLIQLLRIKKRCVNLICSHNAFVVLFGIIGIMLSPVFAVPPALPAHPCVKG